MAFFTSLIWQESRFRPRAVSPVGAQGVAQFMPYVASAMGLDNPFNPTEALPTAARLLRTLVNQFNGNFGLAAAAYNYGPTRVVKWFEKKGALPKETRDYVKIITGRPAEDWRDPDISKAGFTAPELARCQIRHSRAEVSESGDMRFHEVANVPLPKRRPDPAMLVPSPFDQAPEYQPRPQNEAAVADARPRAGRRGAVTAMQPSVAARNNGFARSPILANVKATRITVTKVGPPKTQIIAGLDSSSKPKAKPESKSTPKTAKPEAKRASAPTRTPLTPVNLAAIGRAAKPKAPIADGVNAPAKAAPKASLAATPAIPAAGRGQGKAVRVAAAKN